MTYTLQGPFTTGGTATAANLTAMDAGIGAALPLDGSAGMTGALKLAAGHQESGYIGYYNDSAAANRQYGVGVNFKTQMTNVPSSITISTVIQALNAASVFADGLSQYGFRLIVLVGSSSGTVGVAGSYTTVGNCLLAVDEAAQTFDHHCDGCGAIRRQLPLSALLASTPVETLARLAYTCPDCHTSESFYCGMTAADEADTTPQGAGAYATTRGAQAVMIRQLLALLGLPVAA